MKPDLYTKKLIRLALKEDLGSGDVTTRLLVSPRLNGSGIILAKENGILAGSSVVIEVFKQVSRRIRCQWLCSDGHPIKKGKAVAKISGPVGEILKAERTALNFISHLSGVASLTNRFVERVKGTRAQILDTRKTTPLWRSLQKYAVRMGGGCNHRMGLWDQGLIKDNHWELVIDSKKISRVIKKSPEHRWIVEMTKQNLQYAEKILEAKPRVILLDNFILKDLARAVQLIRKISKKYKIHPLIEASGGIHLRNVRAFAKTGVDRISIGALTHSAPVLDFSLELKKVKM